MTKKKHFFQMATSVGIELLKVIARLFWRIVELCLQLYLKNLHYKVQNLWSKKKILNSESHDLGLHIFVYF